jgi:predicted RNA-binding Zn-ribbon protein involved in translation (DUF1610 family)
VDKRILAAIVVVAVIAALVYIGMSVAKNRRATSARLSAQREWANAQYSQEIVCDNCGEHTAGLNLNRAQVANFQKCPECGAMAGRPIVYFVCQDPACNRQLIKVATTVWAEGRPSPGDPVVCPRCGRSGPNISPDFLSLKSAQKVANDTGQEFP